VGELSDKNFGLIIAYVLPGFVALWGVSHFSTTVESWIGASQQGSPTVAGFCYLTLASLAAGLTVSAVRWILVDSLHHATGIAPPTWKFANLDDRLQGFLVLVENHYRFYQFHANMFIAAAFTYAAQLTADGDALWQQGWSIAGFIALEATLLAGSRDTLRKYYCRTRQLLNTPNPRKGARIMTNGIGHKHVAPAKKPVVKKQAPVAKPDSVRASQTQSR
jgi:hypothetical protein